MSASEAADTVREALDEFVPEGFRDDDGVWHEGPHLTAALAALDALIAAAERADTLAEILEPFATRERAFFTMEDVRLARAALADRATDGNTA